MAPSAKVVVARRPHLPPNQRGVAYVGDHDRIAPYVILHVFLEAPPFDLLLLVVLGLLLYSVSARDPRSPPGAFDVVQVVLVVSVLLADAVALWAIAGRITEFGFTPNRAAALGENVILLVNLAWSAVLYVRFLRGRGSFTSLEKWQTDYLPVYVAWAAIVVIFFPPLFRYI